MSKTRVPRWLHATWDVLHKLLPIVVSVVALYRSCDLGKRVRTVEYTRDAEAHRPLLIAEESFDISGLHIDTTLTVLQAGEPATAVVLRLFGRIITANAASTPARLIGCAVYDTVSGTDVVRRQLLNAEFSLAVSISSEMGYGRGYLLEGETTSVGLNHKLEHAEDSSAVVHVVLLYENESGKLYDTYLWIVIDKLRVRLINTAQGNLGIEASVADSARQSDDSRIYSEAEAKTVRARVSAQHGRIR